MKPLLLAMQFLTRIPIPSQEPFTDLQVGRSVLFYPLAGLIIGGLLTLITYSFQAVPVQVHATVALTVWVLITGGLHLDGLADCADAWIGGQNDKKRSLDIMKDPAAGPVAVIVLFLVLLFKWTVLVETLDRQLLPPLLLTPVLARLSILVLMISTPYIRPGGLGENLVLHLPKKPAWLVLVSCSLVIAIIVGAVPVFAGLFTTLWIRSLAMKRLQGATGDVYGASVELVEVAVLAAMLV